jgi:molecular chaperone GrpE
MTTKRPTAHDRAEAPEPEPAADHEQRLEALQGELEDSRNRHLRLAADFENYKKRARQEAEEARLYASVGLVDRLLPVLDDFNRVLEHAPEGVDENWLKGVRLTAAKLEEVLASVGLQPIESVGGPFDPKLHEAIGSEESDEHPEDTVVSELRRGYRLHDRVVRPALVKVSRKPVGAA